MSENYNNSNNSYSLSSAENSDSSPSRSPLPAQYFLAPPSHSVPTSPSSISSISSISPSPSTSPSPSISPSLSPSHIPSSTPNAILDSGYPFCPPVSISAPLIHSTFQNEISEMEDLLLKRSFEYAKKEKEVAKWMQNGNTVYHHGNVGINTSVPVEALTVDGNITNIFILIKIIIWLKLI